MPELIVAASHHEVLLLVIRIAILLAAARGLGELFTRFGQPAVVGEILAGVILGPSLVGGLFPAVGEWIIPQSSAQLHMLDVASLLGAMFLLILTGLETDIPLIKRHAKTAVSTSIGGIAVTFSSGFLLATVLPDSLVANPEKRIVFDLFVATAMSVSAIPVIAKVLMDLGLMRRTVGQTILASGMVDDTIAWTLISMILGIATATHFSASTLVFAGTKILVFIILSMTVGRVVIGRMLNAVQDRGVSPERVLTFVIAVAFAFGAITQALGIEAVLGAFVVGIILSTLPRLPHQVVERMESVTIGFFAPLFFANAGLKVNLRDVATPELAGFAVAVIAVAIVGKYVGTYLGSRLLAKQDHYSALAYGSGLNARGAVEIIVAGIGLNVGILTEGMYSIVVMMAIVTSVMAPFGLRWALARVPIDEEEVLRLEREKLDADNFLKRVNRVLIPLRIPGGDKPLKGPWLTGSKLILLRGLPKGVAITLFSIVDEQERPRAQEYLSKVSECIGDADIQIRIVSGGDATDRILEEAARGYNLILIGSTASAEGAIFNHAIDKIVRLAPCSVVVAAGDEMASDWTPSTILVPSNGSAASRNAAETAFMIAAAAANTPEVIALHVATPPDPTVKLPTEGSHSFGQDVVNGLKTIGHARGIDVRTRVRVGRPSSAEILAEARETGTELIILGTDLRPGAHRLHLGLGVETVLMEAKGAVLVVNVAN